MPLQNIVTVLVRLLVLREFLEGFSYLIGFLFSIAEQFPPPVWMFVSFAAVILLAVWIWTYAGSIARLVTRGSDCPVSVGSLSLTDCYTLLFTAVSLLTIIGYFSSALMWTRYLFILSAPAPGLHTGEEFNSVKAAQSILPLIVGVLLFVYSRSLAIKMVRRDERKSGPAALSPWC